MRGCSADSLSMQVWRTTISKLSRLLERLPPAFILLASLVVAIAASWAIIGFQQVANDKHEASEVLVRLHSEASGEHARNLRVVNRGRLTEADVQGFTTFRNNVERALAQVQALQPEDSAVQAFASASAEYWRLSDEAMRLSLAGQPTEARGLIALEASAVQDERLDSLDSLEHHLSNDASTAETRAAVGTVLVLLGGATCIGILYMLASRLRASVQRAHELLQEERAREEEREQIAMDLHDGVMQEIYGVSLMLEIAREESNGNGAMAGRMDTAIGQLQNVIRDIRSSLFDLRSREFSGDLRVALQSLALELHENSRIETTVSISPGALDLSPEQQAMFYYVAHEAMSNARKHANPNRIDLTLDVRDEAIEMVLRDDGSGFEVEGGRSEQHRGLRNMARRAERLGAKLALDSGGRGTVVRLQLATKPTLAGRPVRLAA